MFRRAAEPLLERLSRHVIQPLSAFKNRSARFTELAKLRESQWWSLPAIESSQLAALQKLVEYCRLNVPYYVECIPASFSPRSLSDLEGLPLLRKADLRAQKLQLLVHGISESQLLSAKTGGSTGTSLEVLFDEETRQRKNAAAMRADEWAGWRIGAGVAALWGNPPTYKTLRGKLFSALQERVIFCDTMLLTDASVQEFNREFARTGTRFLFGHAHSIFRFCESLERQRLAAPKLAGIVSTSMMLIDSERQFIERVLGCPVTNRYGCEEVGLIACECDRHDGLHINEDHLIVEIVDDSGHPVPDGSPGLVCVTDLTNFKMPLVRYVVEDIAVRSTDPCLCGRRQNRLSKIVGRTADFLKRLDGGLVAGVSLVERTLTALASIRKMQIVQDRSDHVLVLVVADNTYDATTELRLMSEMSSSMGPGVQVEIQQVSSIALERNGKYRFAICKC